MLPHAALPPPHVSVQLPVVQVIEPHAPEPVQLRVQAPVVHDWLPQAALPPLHVEVQSPVVHVIAPHAAEPVQVAMQSAVVQLIAPHALAAVHLTSHFAALVQLIAPHAPDVAHSMLHVQPAGQVMLPLPVPMMPHVPAMKSQRPPQMAGHTAASAMRASAGRLSITQ